MPRRVFCTPALLLLSLLIVLPPLPAKSQHQTSGCKQNGTMYGEGSAMVTASHCEYCYCIKGRQHCVQPHCILDVPGCRPEYNKHSCCPIKYHCSDMRNSTSTTTASTVLEDSEGGCKVNDTSYPEGEKVAGFGEQCENCYCMKGRVRCEPTICPIPLESCSPVHSPGHCCPTSYNCSDVESTTQFNGKEEEITTTEPGMTSVIMSFSTGKSEVESTTLDETTEPSTLEPLGNDTELRSATENDLLNDDGVTVNTTPSELTTALVTELTRLPDDTSSTPVRSIPDVLEAIINRTLAKDEDYEYDYNEPSLPPSLPNLKIIPFVAADAVLNDQDEYSTRLEGKTEIPIYLDVPKPNRFSPPSKTEGGFVPRDPVIDGPFYETKFGKPFTEKIPQLELTSGTLLPPITEPTKLFEEGKCEKDGHTYLHGEVVSEPNACELCVCYYKEVHCQKPDCNPVKAGCHRIQEKDSCCGREICDETRLTEGIETTSTTPLPESMSNIPAITVADLIVTPNPFKDVIRTEPAPNLTDIMKDMPQPHLTNDSSVGNNIKNSTHSNQNETDIITNNLNSTSHLINADYIEVNVTSMVSNKDNLTDPIKNKTLINNSSNISDDYDDSFSFSSVLDMLFRGDSPARKPNKPSATTTTIKPHTPTYNSIYNIHVTDQKQDINNAIENLESDYIAQKNKITQNPNEFSLFHDYQADDTSRNDTKENSPSENRDTDKIESKMDTDKTSGVAETVNKTMKEDLGSGLLKLAGCNIYGRMYRVGRIISELSGPCLECMCTEFGVQCRKLC